MKTTCLPKFAIGKIIFKHSSYLSLNQPLRLDLSAPATRLAPSLTSAYWYLFLSAFSSPITTYSISNIKKSFALFFVLLLAGCSAIDHTVSLEPIEATAIEAIPKKQSIYQIIDGIMITKTHCHSESGEGYIDYASSDVWDRVRDGIVLDTHADHKRIDDHINWFKKHPEYLARVNNRARPYIYYIVGELEKNNIPQDIALLPIVESAFDPFAYSSSFASGMWQFIPNTGKHLGLKQTWWYDGRRDVVESTRAAIEYLSMLANHYDGDWLLALAAYNSGMGRVDREIRKNVKANKGIDFWSLSLPRETKAYVPKLIALSRLIKHPDQYNVNWTATPNTPYFETIALTQQVDLKKAAKLGGISMGQLRQLNPGFNRTKTDPQGPYPLLWPVGKSALIKANLYTLTNNPQDLSNFYVVENGDNLWDIASKHQTSVSKLAAWNNIKSSSTLKIGQKLSLGSAMPASLNNAGRADSANYIRKLNYSVRSGDSLSRIATKFKVTVSDLKRWNDLSKHNVLKPGQRLTLYVDVSKTS
jgi:membrane-bound lytic murein transglycosylase D